LRIDAEGGAYNQGGASLQHQPGSETCDFLPPPAYQIRRTTHMLRLDGQPEIWALGLPTRAISFDRLTGDLYH
jgi:hypothetical protein